jgi:MFS superfamily sulfate permease-like transporter
MDGGVVMDDLIAKIVLSALGLLMAVWIFLRWQKKKNIWLLLATIVAVMAAAAFWLGLVNGIFLAVMAAALLFLGLWTKRGAQ